MVLLHFHRIDKPAGETLFAVDFLLLLPDFIAVFLIQLQVLLGDVKRFDAVIQKVLQRLIFKADICMPVQYVLSFLHDEQIEIRYRVYHDLFERNREVCLRHPAPRLEY
jgi:hypothetical protein